MSSSSQKNVSLVVIVLSLLVAGGLLFAAIRELSAEIERDGPTGSGEISELHEASAQGDVARMRSELDAGVAVDATTEGAETWMRGMTPLMLAIFHKQPDSVSLLLERGADPDATASDGRTPLIYAAGWGSADTVRELLERDVTIDARARDGWTALMMASGSRGDPESVELLIAKGANTSFRNKWGQTALHLSAVSRDERKIRALLAGGADVSVRDNEGATPLSILAANDADAELLAELIEAAGDPRVVNAADNDGITPLMRAADRGDADKVLVLLNAGADTEPADVDGRTALEWAETRDDELGRRVAEILRDARG
ncbi:MAG: ankyrin repeat domain-containing protein [Planctomycetota bacterium]